MMKFSRFKMLFIAPALLITSCGYGLKEVYDGLPYNSTKFTENYYGVWDDAINPDSPKTKINDKRDVHELGEADKLFRSTSEAAFKDCDPHWNEYSYESDLYEPENGTKAYGPAVCLSNYDESFKYGIVSKMFDGQMFCNGYYQMARTQIEPTNQNANAGIGVLFSKECNNASYFMMNFKCALVSETSQDLPFGRTNLNLDIGFILKNDTGYTYLPLRVTVNDVPTNSGDANRSDGYVCLGFNFSQLPELNRLIGFTVKYQKTSDTISPSYPDVNLYHALMLYEVSFPYTTWN